MYFPGNVGDSVYEYNLSEAYNITTAVFVTSIRIDLAASSEDVPLGLDFSRDGTKMFVEGNDNDGVDQYNLSDAFNISSAVFVQSFVVDEQTNTPRGLRFIPDGTKMFVGATDKCDILVYDLSEAHNISTAVFAQSLDISVEGCSPSGIDFNLNGSTMFYLTLGGVVNEYSLEGDLLVLQDDGDLAVDVDTLFVDANNDKVGIGTNNPTEVLDVNGGLIVDNGTLYVDANNNRTGIGITSPTTRLEVNGSINVTGTGVYYGNGSGLTGIGADSLNPNSINTTQIIDSTILDADISDTTNLTLGQKLTFALGGFIQNIVSGQVDINGTLNVTNNLIVEGNLTVTGDLNVAGAIQHTDFESIVVSSESWVELGTLTMAQGGHNALIKLQGGSGI